MKIFVFLLAVFTSGEAFSPFGSTGLSLGFQSKGYSENNINRGSTLVVNNAVNTNPRADAPDDVEYSTGARNPNIDINRGVASGVGVRFDSPFRNNRRLNANENTDSENSRVGINGVFALHNQEENASSVKTNSRTVLASGYGGSAGLSIGTGGARFGAQSLSIDSTANNNRRSKGDNDNDPKINTVLASRFGGSSVSFDTGEAGVDRRSLIVSRKSNSDRRRGGNNDNENVDPNEDDRAAPVDNANTIQTSKFGGSAGLSFDSSNSRYGRRSLIIDSTANNARRREDNNDIQNDDPNDRRNTQAGSNRGFAIGNEEENVYNNRLTAPVFGGSARLSIGSGDAKSSRRSVYINKQANDARRREGNNIIENIDTNADSENAQAGINGGLVIDNEEENAGSAKTNAGNSLLTAVGGSAGLPLFTSGARFGRRPLNIDGNVNNVLRLQVNNENDDSNVDSANVRARNDLSIKPYAGVKAGIGGGISFGVNFGGSADANAGGQPEPVENQRQPSKSNSRGSINESSSNKRISNSKSVVNNSDNNSIEILEDNSFDNNAGRNIKPRRPSPNWNTGRDNEDDDDDAMQNSVRSRSRTRSHERSSSKQKEVSVKEHYSKKENAYDHSYDHSS